MRLAYPLLLLLGLSLGLLLSEAALAQKLVSPNFELRGGTLSGGGGVGVQGTASGTVVGTTLGQPPPLGISSGPTSGIRLEAGFWPIAATPVPEPSAAALLACAAAALAALARGSRPGARRPARQMERPARSQ